MTSEDFFFIGTEAELIKVFPVILGCKKRGRSVYIIASGQNDISKSRIVRHFGWTIDLMLSREEGIRKEAAGLLLWFLRTQKIAVSSIRARFPETDFSAANMIVHGDTFSTVMGARTGRKLGMRVCHIEAGLRSHHLFSPFPEEIDRLLVSRYARLHFAPGRQACQNLQKACGRVVDTEWNTLLDSLKFSQEIPYESDQYLKLPFGGKFFVFVIHRQENLSDHAFLRKTVSDAITISSKIHCVMILHPPTKVVLGRLGLLPRLEECETVSLIPRLEYFDFMKLLYLSEFVITDGGSNQEELYYIGKPCLIMRKATERSEGLGENAKLYGGDSGAMLAFADEYRDYCRPPVQVSVSPSERIVMEL